MPKYEIEQYELHVMRYRVEADSEAQAIVKLFQGEAEPVEQSQEYIEIADDYGLPADEHGNSPTSFGRLAHRSGRLSFLLSGASCGSSSGHRQAGCQERDGWSP